MPKFAYEAKQGPGDKVHGMMEAESRADCVGKLTQKGWYPLSITEMGEGDRGVMESFRGRISSRDIEGFTRQLASLLESGLTLLKALQVLEGQRHKPAFARVITQLADSIKDGTPFSDSLAQFPQVFSDLYVNMARSGEVGGNLEVVLNRLADFSEQREELQTRIRTAMAYPMLMAVVGTATIAILLTFVVPTIAGMFADLGQALPLPTRILLGTSRILILYGWMVAVAGVLSFLVFQRALKSSEARLTLDRLWLKLPLVGDLTIKTNITQLARTLGTLLESGVPILSALEVAQRTLSNELLRSELGSMHEEVSAGSSLAATFAKRPIFPSMIANLVSVGEEGGQLEQALGRIANTYDRDTRRAVSVLTSLLEPAMILLMGSVVGFIVISMLLPIFELNVLMR